ncbi:MAG: hypothetical protein BWY94_00447 [Actinobacteria bacterium ADurb.BinA094]|nr:MAG: hypothetical protein BWY94_00447 [Actinobacteria bacterium ADurb.BinA094]
MVGGRDDPEARRLHAAALATPRPLRTVQWLDPSQPDDAAHLERTALPVGPGVAAAGYVCRGHSCSPFHP